MKFTFTKFFSISSICVLILFTSCIPKENSNNYQTFSQFVGSIVTIENVKYFRLDADGSLFYSTTFLSDQYASGDRIIISGSIDYNDQIAGTPYLVTKIDGVIRINKKMALSFDSIEKDTFKNDAILGQTWSYIAYTNNQYIYTSKAFINASNQYHAFDLVNNRINLNDTLKFEVRHNSKLDAEKTLQVINITSYDLTAFLDTIPPGKTKIIQIAYKTDTRVVKQNISFLAQ
ncbi:MAG: hypothetical protein ACOYOT_08285 [Bacteroidales bacterium]